MSEQMVLTVLNEVLDELKEANKLQKEMAGTMKTLEGRVAGFEQMLKDQQVIVQPPDLDPAFGEIRQMTRETGVAASETIETVQAAAKAMLEQVHVMVEQKLSEIGRVINDRLAEQPKPVIRQWRFILFPESDRQGSYKYFISWLFGGTVLMLLVGTLFLLGRQYLDKWHPPPDEPRQSLSMPHVNPPSEFKAAAPAVVRRRVLTSPWRLTNSGELTTRDARRRVDSVARAKKIEKIIDTLHNILIQYLPDSLREKGVKQPQKNARSAVVVDSFYNIKK